MSGGVVAVVQARMGSTRLPGKVLLDIAGRPMLTRVMQRLELATRLDARVLATSHLPQDDPIAELCQREGLRGFRGEPPGAFAANRLPRRRTYPIGLDTEVCSMAALEQAWRQAAEPHQREHVMPFFYENPARFRILLLGPAENPG